MSEDRTNVVPIRAGVAPDPDAGSVNEATVKELEDILQRARAGEVVGVAYACQHPGRLTTFHYVGFVTRACIGAVGLLHAKMCKHDLE